MQPIDVLLDDVELPDEPYCPHCGSSEKIAIGDDLPYESDEPLEAYLCLNCDHEYIWEANG